MNKICFFSILIIIFLAISCDKEASDNKTNLNGILDGWKISKYNFNFAIIARDIFFINSEIGFIVGYDGEIYKTINAGKSWQRLNSGTTLQLYSVFFLNENIGFVAGQSMTGCLSSDCDKGSVLLKTLDGGETWNKIFFKDYTDIQSLWFFDDLKGLAIIIIPSVPNSRSCFIAKTSDGGNNWELIDLAIDPPYCKFFCVDNIVFIIGEHQTIYKSTDFGNNWETITTPIEPWNDVRGLYFYNENIGFIDGITKRYKTIDGGLNWKIVDFPFQTFTVFHFYNESEGFNIESEIVFNDEYSPTFIGSIGYQTFNGGENWIKSELIDSISIMISCFPERNLGFGLNLKEFYLIKKEK
jgi:photosystem II stability/assembly factor-like uncharacterized protein